MTSIEGFLARLRRQDIRVWVEDGRLRCSAPEGALTAALQAELSQRKEDILASIHAKAGASAPASPAIGTLDSDREVPPSFGQRRLWFIESMAPEVAVYNITMPFCFEVDLDIAALRSSLASIVERHEDPAHHTCAVRRRDSAGGRSSAQSARHRRGDGGSDGCGTGCVRARDREAERSRKFNLTREPLLRARLIRIGEQDHVLILQFTTALRTAGRSTHPAGARRLLSRGRRR